MNCIIIEDQPPAQRILKKYIADIGSLTLQGTFSDALEALAFLKTAPIDLIFLDIHLPKISGMDFLKTLPHAPHVILTTAFSQYALESYDLDVVDYLLKPFSFQRFVKAVAKVPAPTLPVVPPILPSPTPLPIKEVFIKSGYEHIKINLQEVNFIKSDSDYTEIHLPGKKHVSAEPLRYWIETLPLQQFVQIHKSYIINSTKIEKIRGNQVYLKGGISLPIGRAYKDAFVKRFIH